MDRGFDAGEAVVPDVNGNVNEDVDVDVNTRVGREMIPAAVPVGRGEPTMARVGTGEGMVLPPQSEGWLSGIFRVIPSTQRVRSFVGTPEMMIVLLGLASLISLVIFIFDVITTKSFRPLTVTVFLSAGGYCILLIQRPSEDDQVLAGIMEERAAGASKRVLTKEERRSLFHYFTLRPPTPLENAFYCRDTSSEASPPPGASTPSGESDRCGAEGFSRKALVQSSSDGEEAGKVQGGHPLSAIVPPRDGSLGNGESSAPTGGETRTVESETRRGERRSGSALRKVFGGPRPDGIEVMKSIEAGARGQQLPDRAAVGEIIDETPREEESGSAGACSTDDAVAGCLRDGHACSAPEEREKDGKKGEVTLVPLGVSVICTSTKACAEQQQQQTTARRRASRKWSTGGQCVVCYEKYTYGEDLCQLPCCHMYHASCIDDWLAGANHNWCPVCKQSVLGDDQDQETSDGGGGIGGEAV